MLRLIPLISTLLHIHLLIYHLFTCPWRIWEGTVVSGATMGWQPQNVKIIDSTAAARGLKHSVVIYESSSLAESSLAIFKILQVSHRVVVGDVPGRIKAKRER